MDLRLRIIAPEGLGSSWYKKRIVLSPDNQHPRLSVAEVLVPAVVERNVRLVVVEKIELDRVIARTVQKELVQCIGIGTDPLRVFNPMRVLENGGLFREQTSHRLLRLCVPIDPEWLHRVEGSANPLHIRVAILNHNAFDGSLMF